MNRLRLPDGTYVDWQPGHPVLWLDWIKPDTERWKTLPTRVANAILQAGFFDLDRVLTMSKEETLVVQGVGKKGYNYLQELKDRNVMGVESEDESREVVIRVLTFSGPKSVVEEQLKHSLSIGVHSQFGKDITVVVSEIGRYYQINPFS